MRCTTSLATAALALALPFVLSHCASVPGPLTYDAKSVGGPNSGAPMELWLPPGTGPFQALERFAQALELALNHSGILNNYAAALKEPARAH
jgi:hypothetical protein